MPLGPQLMKAFDIDPHHFGWLISSYSLASGLSGLSSALFIDRFDRKKSLLFLTAGFSLGTLACGLASSYIFMIIARALAGVFGGIISSQVLAIVGDRIAAEKRGQATGIVMMTFSLASVLGVPLSIYMATHISWHAPFIFLGIFAAVMTALGMNYLPSMVEHLKIKQEKKAIHDIIELLRRRATLLPLLLSALLIFSQFLIIPFISPSLVANVGIAPADLTFLYLLGGLSTIITSPRVGKWIDRSSSLDVLQITTLASLLPILLVTHLFEIPFVIVLLIGITFFIASSSRNVPILNFLNSRIPANLRGRYMSLNTCLQSLSMATASSLAGTLIVRSPEGRLLHFERVGYLSCALSVVAWIIVRNGFRAERGRKS